MKTRSASARRPSRRVAVQKAMQSPTSRRTLSLLLLTATLFGR